MHPGLHAQQRPNAVAIIMASSGEVVTYAELEERANRGAQLFRALGLRTGDSIAIWMPNNAHYLEICWAAQRSGLYYTPISTHLSLAEAAYIINDSEASLLLASPDLPGVEEIFAANNQAQPSSDFKTQLSPDLKNQLSPDLKIFLLNEARGVAKHWLHEVAAMSCEPISDGSAGQNMMYSSGTTGKPKGIQLPLSGAPADAPLPFVATLREKYFVTADTVFFIPAPLYHAAPLICAMTTQSIGGTVVINEQFEPTDFLAAIERYKVTHIQLVPTLFVRLLKLPLNQRMQYDLSSLEFVVHSAAPCPVKIKEQMLEWWGPIIYEYYGGSESVGSTYITPDEWLRKKGSVGRAQWGELHICDDEGNELPIGEQGTVYFSGGFDFKYKNDDEKTKESRNPLHPTWSTLGDIGYLDQDGYLFLTDRRSFMIISGGVNIYPQEVENLLLSHPKIMDAGVIGIPNEEFGEEVKAVIQPVHWNDAGPEFAAEIINYCRAHLSGIKCPRSIDFDAALPRMENGKLYKKALRDRYW